MHVTGRLPDSDIKLQFSLSFLVFVEGNGRYLEQEFSALVLLTFWPGLSLLWGPAVYIVGCLAAFLVSTTRCQWHSCSCDNQKCLHTLLNVLWEAKPTLLRTTDLEGEKKACSKTKTDYVQIPPFTVLELVDHSPNS